jgi:hypothetical protein
LFLSPTGQNGPAPAQQQPHGPGDGLARLQQGGTAGVLEGEGAENTSALNSVARGSFFTQRGRRSHLQQPANQLENPPPPPPKKQTHPQGNALNVVRTAPFKALNFFSFDMYSRALARHMGPDVGSLRFLAGAAAGAFWGLLVAVESGWKMGCGALSHHPAVSI